MMKKLLATLALAAAPGLFAGVIVYDNTTANPLNAVVFSAGGYTAIGDQVTLDGTARLGESATVQMYNLTGNTGAFNAGLNLYNTSGSLLGSFSLNGLSAVAAGPFDVTFNLGGLTLTDSLIFAVSISNASPDIDLAVLTSDGPFVGSSDNSFYVNNTGAGFFQDTSFGDNIAMKLSANVPSTNGGGGAVPEPSTFVMLGLGIAAVGLGRKYVA